MAKKPTPGKALVKWDEEFANLSKETSKGIKSSEGKFISFKSGRMSFAGQDIPDNEIRCVIIGWTHHNAYYGDEPFDPSNPQTPVCYSFGDEEEDMEPHADSPDKQCGSCAECPFNQFESAGRGRKGKACKNTFRLAIIAEDDLQDLDNAEIAYASIPPKSLRNFSNYLAKDLRKVERPHWAVVTTMSVEPDAQSQFKIMFKCEELIEDSDLFGPLKELWLKTKEDIGFPYQEREAPPPKTRGGKGKPAKFARGR